jgi:hypothetical protein
MKGKKAVNIVQNLYLLYAMHWEFIVYIHRIQGYLRVRKNRKHRQRSRVRDFYSEIEGTGDLNGTHGGGSTISSVVVQKRSTI